MGGGGLVLQAGAWWEFREPEGCFWNAGEPLGLCTQAPERGEDLPKVIRPITVANSASVLAFPEASALSQKSLWPCMAVKAWNCQQRGMDA